MLSCKVSFEDVNLAITLTVMIMGPDTGLLTFPINDVENLLPSETVYTSELTLQRLAFGRGDGTHTCTARIETNELQQYINNSDTGSDSLDVVVLRESK